MARVKPFRRLQIDAEICSKISQIIEERRYRGSFTSFVESVLELYADGLLMEKAMTETKKSGKIATAAGAENLGKPNVLRKAS